MTRSPVLSAARAVTRAVAAIAAALAISACGGGGGDTTAATSTGIVATTGDDGWQLSVLGVNAQDIQALSIDGVEYLPTMRQMAAAGIGHFFDAEDEEGKAFIFSSMRQPADDGLPLKGHVTVTTADGVVTLPLAFTVGQGIEPADVETEGRSTAMGIDWKAVWAKAKKMALKGTANAIIKEYLRGKGYFCPPGPWFLCARPVS
jgi:hypothetical protein